MVVVRLVSGKGWLFQHLLRWLWVPGGGGSFSIAIVGFCFREAVASVASLAPAFVLGFCYFSSFRSTSLSLFDPSVWFEVYVFVGFEYLEGLVEWLSSGFDLAVDGGR
ncbi:hypothetical protein Bca101_049064 [Brassica carinata]